MKWLVTRVIGVVNRSDDAGAVEFEGDEIVGRRNSDIVLVDNRRLHERDLIPRRLEFRSIGCQQNLRRLAGSVKLVGRDHIVTIFCNGFDRPGLETHFPDPRRIVLRFGFRAQRLVIQHQLDTFAIAVDLNALVMRLQIRRRPVAELRLQSRERLESRIRRRLPRGRDASRDLYHRIFRPPALPFPGARFWRTTSIDQPRSRPDDRPTPRLAKVIHTGP